MPSLRTFYIAAMWLTGIIGATLLVLKPSLRGGMIPPILWLMLVTLAIDTIALRTLKKADGQLHPLPLNARGFGFVGAAILFLAICFKNGISPV